MMNPYDQYHGDTYPYSGHNYPARNPEKNREVVELELRVQVLERQLQVERNVNTEIHRDLAMTDRNYDALSNKYEDAKREIKYLEDKLWERSQELDRVNDVLDQEISYNQYLNDRIRFWREARMRPAARQAQLDMDDDLIDYDEEEESVNGDSVDVVMP